MAGDEKLPNLGAGLSMPNPSSNELSLLTVGLRDVRMWKKKNSKSNTQCIGPRVRILMTIKRREFEWIKLNEKYSNVSPIALLRRIIHYTVTLFEKVKKLLMEPL